jgi:hypothetical protein
MKNANSEKDSVQKMKTQIIDQEKILENLIFNKGHGLSMHEELPKLNSENKRQPHYKTGKTHEQTRHRRRDTDNSHVHERKPGITSQQRNANESHNEVRLHTCPY